MKKQNLPSLVQDCKVSDLREQMNAVGAASIISRTDV